MASIAATLGASVLPALIGTRVNAGESLRVIERGGTETRAARAATRGLLVAEIALACTLLVGATLLVRSFINLAGADRGLDATGVLTATMSLPRQEFPDRVARAAAAQLLEAQVRQLPGIHQVAWSYGLPPSGGAISFGHWQSDVPGAPVLDMDVGRFSVGPEFFALYGIPLVRGRVFERSDSGSEVIVGERLAAVLWPGLDPVGRSFSFGKERFHVIGLVRETHHPALDARLDRPEFYEPFSGVEARHDEYSLRCRLS